jgi:hypothetical protein
MTSISRGDNLVKDTINVSASIRRNHVKQETAYFALETKGAQPDMILHMRMLQQVLKF